MICIGTTYDLTFNRQHLSSIGNDIYYDVAPPRAFLKALVQALGGRGGLRGGVPELAQYPGKQPGPGDAQVGGRHPGEHGAAG